MPGGKVSAHTKFFGAEDSTLAFECIIANTRQENISSYQIHVGPNFGAEDSTLASECIIANTRRENIGSYQIHVGPNFGAEDGTLASECIIVTLGEKISALTKFM